MEKGGKFWNFSSSEGYEPRKGKTEGGSAFLKGVVPITKTNISSFSWKVLTNKSCKFIGGQFFIQNC